MSIKQTIRPLGCANGGCPGILVTDNGTVLVQGLKTTQPTGVEVPDHEDLVAIPGTVFEELLRQYIHSW